MSQLSQLSLGQYGTKKCPNCPNCPLDSMEQKMANCPNCLLPVNDKIGIDSILQAADYYFERTGRRVTYEYVLISGVNDEPRLAKQLAALLRKRNAHVNLIPMNNVETLPYRMPTAPQTQQFASILEEAGIATTVRKRKGEDIDAACGQLKLLNESRLM